MKTILMAASALAMLAAPVAASAQVSSVTFTGTVDSKCNIPSVNQNVPINLGVDANGYVNGGNQGWTTLFDLGALSNGAEAWCNTSTTIGVSGTAMLHETEGSAGNYGLPNGFTAAIPMQIADASIGGAYGVAWTSSELNTGVGLDTGNGIPVTQEKTSAGAFAGPVTGLIQLWNADRRPIAGDYASTWTVTVTTN